MNVILLIIYTLLTISGLIRARPMFFCLGSSCLILEMDCSGMEILVRIAFDRFFKTKICITVKKPVKKLFKDYIFPCISNYKINTIITYNTN